MTMTWPQFYFPNFTFRYLRPNYNCKGQMNKAIYCSICLIVQTVVLFCQFENLLTKPSPEATWLVIRPQLFFLTTSQKSRPICKEGAFFLTPNWWRKIHMIAGNDLPGQVRLCYVMSQTPVGLLWKSLFQQRLCMQPTATVSMDMLIWNDEFQEFQLLDKELQGTNDSGRRRNRLSQGWATWG